MKLHVMHDQNGKIVAAVRLDEDRAKPRFSGQRIIGPRPVPIVGFTCVDLDVPDEHAHFSFEEVCQRLIVEPCECKPYFKLQHR
jgi:hypothetical protein